MSPSEICCLVLLLGGLEGVSSSFVVFTDVFFFVVVVVVSCSSGSNFFENFFWRIHRVSSHVCRFDDGLMLCQQRTLTRTMFCCVSYKFWGEKIFFECVLLLVLSGGRRGVSWYFAGLILLLLASHLRVRV